MGTGLNNQGVTFKSLKTIGFFNANGNVLHTWATTRTDEDRY